jgi:hypothetical protein
MDWDQVLGVAAGVGLLAMWAVLVLRGGAGG